MGPDSGEPGARTTWPAIAASGVDLLLLSPCSFSVDRSRLRTRSPTVGLTRGRCSGAVRDVRRRRGVLQPARRSPRGRRRARSLSPRTFDGCPSDGSLANVFARGRGGRMSGGTPLFSTWTSTAAPRQVGRVTTSRTELLQIGIAYAVLSFCLLILLSGSSALFGTGGSGLLTVTPTLVVVAATAALTGFVAHEMAHKIAAQRRGFWAEFRLSPMGLIIALFTAVLGLLFAAPGATMVGGIHPADRKSWGETSLAGPLANFGFGVIFYAAALGTYRTRLDALRRVPPPRLHQRLVRDVQPDPIRGSGRCQGDALEQGDLGGIDRGPGSLRGLELPRVLRLRYADVLPAAVEGRYVTAVRVIELGQGRQLLDLDFRDTEGLVAAYLLPQEDGWTLIETGPSTCREPLLRGIDTSGVERRDIRRVFVTHIHLDHAGGMGALAEALPRATFYAHELGVPHLADPTRLIASARRTWGAASDPLWGPILPVPAERLHGLHGGERFPLNGGELSVLATPGHARHHLSFYDSGLGGVFTGDSAGVRLERSSRLRPAVPPPDLDLDLLFESVEAMRMHGAPARPLQPLRAEPRRTGRPRALPRDRGAVEGCRSRGRARAPGGRVRHGEARRERPVRGCPRAGGPRPFSYPDTTWRPRDFCATLRRTGCSSGLPREGPHLRPVAGGGDPVPCPNGLRVQLVQHRSARDAPRTGVRDRHRRVRDRARHVPSRSRDLPGPGRVRGDAVGEPNHLARRPRRDGRVHARLRVLTELDLPRRSAVRRGGRRGAVLCACTGPGRVVLPGRHARSDHRPLQLGIQPRSRVSASSSERSWASGSAGGGPSP